MADSPLIVIGNYILSVFIYYLKGYKACMRGHILFYLYEYEDMKKKRKTMPAVYPAGIALLLMIVDSLFYSHTA